VSPRAAPLGGGGASRALLTALPGSAAWRLAASMRRCASWSRARAASRLSAATRSASATASSAHLTVFLIGMASPLPFRATPMPVRFRGDPLPSFGSLPREWRGVRARDRAEAVPILLEALPASPCSGRPGGGEVPERDYHGAARGRAAAGGSRRCVRGVGP
jgi:hypothetical protein